MWDARDRPTQHTDRLLQQVALAFNKHIAARPMRDGRGKPSFLHPLARG